MTATTQSDASEEELDESSDAANTIRRGCRCSPP